MIVLDTILKEHVASLPDKRRRAHRKARQSLSGTVRSRHKRSSQSAAKISPLPSSTPVAVATTSVPNGSIADGEQASVVEHVATVTSSSPALSRSSSLTNIQEKLGKHVGVVKEANSLVKG